MNIPMIICMLLCLLCFNAAYRYVMLDVYLNVAQAAVDASRCMMMIDQINYANADVMCGVREFDLPFMELTVQPHWWYEIWLFDFIGRQIVAEYAAQTMTVQWPEFPTAEF